MVVTEITGFKFNPLATYEEFTTLKRRRRNLSMLDIKVTRPSTKCKSSLEFRQLYKKYFENNFGDIDKFIQYKRFSLLQKQTMFQFQKDYEDLYDL